MKTLFSLIVVMVFGLVACDLEDLSKKKEENQKEETASCSSTKYGQCLTTVEGQIYYSQKDIMNDYDLTTFTIFLLGKVNEEGQHSYSISDPDKNGNFSDQVETGDYTLMAFYDYGNRMLGDGLWGTFRDSHNNLYFLGNTGKFQIEEDTNSLFTLDLYNLKRIYWSADTGDIIVITNNTNGVAGDLYKNVDYADQKIKEYFGE